MGIQKTEKILGQLVLSVLLAALLSVCADMIVFLAGGFLRGRYHLLLFVILTLIFSFLCIFRKQTKTLVKFLLGTVTAIAVLYLAWLPFHKWGSYKNVDSGKNAFFADRRVMLIVPHQDDEINVLGGVVEEYVSYGSEVFIVFTTNGDSFYSASTRLREAIASASCMGVPEDHLIFLGYGDGWDSKGPHLYNAEEGSLNQSYTGRTETYGLEDHPAYHNGNAYTPENFLNDMKSVVGEYQPDVIYCVDYDAHSDHRATSLLFEKAMGMILKEYPDYHPAVFKGYAYSTAWGAPKDYCAVNVGATTERLEAPYVYRWEDRVRLPVSVSALSRSLSGSNVFRALAAHECQDAETHAAGVANGDKVVWYRNTASLCHDAVIEASSGNETLLNDFMLYDNLDIYGDSSRIDGIWIPDEGDSSKSFTVTFPQSRQIDSIVLYDHPYEDHNVLNAVIELDDGTRIETGPLHPSGIANTFSVDTQAQSFTVTILEQDGQLAGLGEVEAFHGLGNTGGSLLKMADREGNFVYDYILDNSGKAEFSFYTYGGLPAADETHYIVSSSNDSCQAIMENGVLTVTCPRGQESYITVTCRDMPVSDTVIIRNPNTATRIWCNMFLRLEEAYFSKGYKNTPLYQIGIAIVDRLVHLICQ